MPPQPNHKFAGVELLTGQIVAALVTYCPRHPRGNSLRWTPSRCSPA